MIKSHVKIMLPWLI